MCRICKLGDEHWSGLNDQHAGSSYNEPRHDELSKCRGCCLQDAGDDNPNDPKEENLLSSNAITQPPNQWQYQHTSNVLRGVYGAQDCTSWVAEISLPLRHISILITQ
jgi:hypothetical protein